MIQNFHYIGDFHGERSTRIGSSDIPKIFPNPEKPTESLAGYGDTAVSLYYEKTGEKKSYEYPLSAECGHEHETKSLELFIRRFFGFEIAFEFKYKKQEYENLLQWAKLGKCDKPNAENYQVGLFRHNVEYIHDSMIVHPDCIYLGDSSLLDAPRKERFITVEGITVDKAKPFYIEAKSARKEATKRREGTFVKGYDFDSTTWQGIPLKHYVQMQFQSALLEIDTGYLPLLHNTSEFQVWKVDKSKSQHKTIINTVGKMLKHIEDKKPPKEMAISLADVVRLYPEGKDDFYNPVGEQLKVVKQIIKEAKEADQQIKNWKAKEKDCKDALAVHLGEFKELRDGSDRLVVWQSRKGSRTLSRSVKDLEKEYPRQYRYLIKNDLIKQNKDSRYISIK